MAREPVEQLTALLTLEERRSTEMLKKRIIAAIVGLALLAAVTGSYGIVADLLELAASSQVQAVADGCSSGGGC